MWKNIARKEEKGYSFNFPEKLKFRNVRGVFSLVAFNCGKQVGTDVNSQRRMMWQKLKGKSQRNSAHFPTLKLCYISFRSKR